MRIVKLENAEELAGFGAYKRQSTAQKLWDEVQKHGRTSRNRGGDIPGSSSGYSAILALKKIDGKIYGKLSWQSNKEKGGFTAKDLARIERGDFE